MLERHVLPVLGHLELAMVSSQAVRSWYTGMRKDYVTTEDGAYRMLRPIFVTAVSDSLIASGPCQVKGAGAARSAERPIASIAEPYSCWPVTSGIRDAVAPQFCWPSLWLSSELGDQGLALLKMA